MATYLTRHGETNFNKSNLIQGHSKDSILTPKGKEQILSLANDLRNRIFDVIYVSDLPRTIECANILEQELNWKNIIRTVFLREQQQGLFEGLPYNFSDFQILKKHERLNDKTYKKLIEQYQAESIHLFKKRIQAFFKDIDSTKENLCITHGGVISIITKKDNIKNGRIYLLNN